MLRDEQLHRYEAMERDHLAEKEYLIRQMAVSAAQDTRPGPMKFAVLSTYPGFYAKHSSAHTWALDTTDVHVELHPAIQGFARILIAEEIIREQLS